MLKILHIAIISGTICSPEKIIAFNFCVTAACRSHTEDAERQTQQEEPHTAQPRVS